MAFGEALAYGEFLRLVDIDLPNDGDKRHLKPGDPIAGSTGDLKHLRDCPSSEDLANDGERYLPSKGDMGD